MSFQQLLSPLLSNWPCLALLFGFEKHTAPVLDSDAVRIATTRLESLCRSTDRKAAARDHVKSLNTRHA